MITIFNGRSRGLGSQPAKDIYVQVSVDLRKYLHLFKGAKLNVFLAIALHGDSQGWSKPSTRILRRETGLSSDTIFKTLGELCELKVEGHRVLLRKGARRTGGQFSSNNYLIFPTDDEVAKFETPYLFAFGPQSESDQQATNTTVSEKAGTAAISGKPVRGQPRRDETPASSGACDSKFSTHERLRYARAQERFLGNGWVAASADGRSDELIQDFFDQIAAYEKRLAAREREDRERRERASFAIACQAVELAMSVNEISLAEAIARLREASSPTPGASSAEAALTWGKVLALIEGKIQKEALETWFNCVRCEGIDSVDRIVFLWAPSQVVRDWIRVNYSNLMDQALGETGLSGHAIKWVTAGEVHPTFRELDEPTVQRVINYFVTERGCKYELVPANEEAA